MGCMQSVQRTGYDSGKKDVKILITGVEGSGKSTFIKQLRLLAGEEFLEQESQVTKHLIIRNTLGYIQSILHAMQKLDIDLDDISLKGRMETISQLSPNDAVSVAGLGNMIDMVWKDVAVRTYFTQVMESSMDVSARYFLDNALTIFSSDYKPTKEDLLQIRAQTPEEVHFILKYFSFHAFEQDPAGMSQLEDVDVVIVLVDISDYNTFSQDVSRWIDKNIALIDDIYRSRRYAQAGKVIVFNKTDILQQKCINWKIDTVSQNCKEVSQDDSASILGQTQYDAACKDIRARFSATSTENNMLYTLFLSCMDTVQVQNAMLTINGTYATYVHLQKVSDPELFHLS